MGYVEGTLNASVASTFLTVLGNEYNAAERALTNASTALSTAVTNLTNAQRTLDNTPETIPEPYCPYTHTYYGVGLQFFTKEDVMNALGFTDGDRQWVEMTEMGFETNPDIP